MTKEKIKIFIMTGEGQVAQKIKGSDGTYKYSGLAYDIWEKIKIKLKNKYEFEEIYKNTNNYSEIVNDVNKGVYDLGISLFTVTNDRMELVDFTNPIYISKDSVLYKTKLTFYKNIVHIFKTIIFIPMLVLFILSIVFGLLLYFFDKTKSNISSYKLIKKKIFKVITALFGGKLGILFNDDSFGIINKLLIILISIVSLIILIFLQAETIIKFQKLSDFKPFSINNMQFKHFLSPDGYAVGKNFIRFGSKITYIKNKSMKELVELYKKQTDKYDGIALDLYDSRVFTKSHDLSVTEEQLGFSHLAFITNKEKKTFLFNINKELVKLNKNFITKNLCSKHFISKKDIPLCVI